MARITQAIKQENAPDSQRAAPASQARHRAGFGSQGGGPRRRPTSKAAKTTLPHQLAASRPADFDLDVLRKRALLGLQVRLWLRCVRRNPVEHTLSGRQLQRMGFRPVAAQIRAGLDASASDRAVYETHKWDPCKPFVADKVGVKRGSSRLSTHSTQSAYSLTGNPQCTDQTCTQHS